MSSTGQVIYGSTDLAGNNTLRVLVDAQGRLQTSAGTSAGSGTTTPVATNSSGARYSTTPPTFGNGQLAENQADVAGNQKVVIASRPGTDRSLTTTAATSVPLMAANTQRNGFFIENDSATDIWINFVGASAASPGAGNKKILANGGYFELKGVSNAVTIFSTAAVAITALEW